MSLSDVRTHIERNYQKADIIAEKVYRLQMLNLVDHTLVNITVEASRAPLVNMTDLTITIEDWPMVMRGDNIVIGVTLFATFHDSEPNYDTNIVNIWQAKESTSYTDDDIENKIRDEWNRSTIAE